MKISSLQLTRYIVELSISGFVGMHRSVCDAGSMVESGPPPGEASGPDPTVRGRPDDINRGVRSVQQGCPQKTKPASREEANPSGMSSNQRRGTISL